MSDLPDKPPAAGEPADQGGSLPHAYSDWLAEVKGRIEAARQSAAQAVNHELVLLYRQLGRDILERQQAQGWGAKVITRLARDLHTAFPDMKGFSRSNLVSIRAFAEAWPEPEIVQQLVGQLPWGQNLLPAKLKTREERLWYAARAAEHGWSRAVMWHHISTGPARPGAAAWR